MTLSKINIFKKWIEINKLDLKPHQIRALKWCLKRDKKKGGIIADEMGLGKTVVSLGLFSITHLKDDLPTLVVVPPALLQQWKKCIENWVCSNPAFLLYHSHTALGGCREYSIEKLQNATIILTTYGMIAARPTKLEKALKVGIVKQKYQSTLWNLKYKRVMYDEAHHMRNPGSNIFIGASRLQNKKTTQWCITGTPIQNSMNDLTSLFDIIKIDYKGMGIAEFKKLCFKYILKRSKKEVGIKLPTCDVETIHVPCENANELYWMKQLHSMVNFPQVTIDNVDQAIGILKSEEKGVFPIITACKQMCTLPSTVSQKVTKKWDDLSRYAIIDQQALKNQLDRHSVGNYSSKVVHVCKKIIERKSKGSKIIFAHYRKEILEYQKILTREGFSVRILDGTTKKADRKSILSMGTLEEKDCIFPVDLVNEINTYLICDILIVQIKSGCEGLNLQAFNEVYFTSPHWNPAVYDQAVARVHRIGQKNSVNIFRFISTLPSGVDGITIDQYTHNVQTAKRSLLDIFKK